MSSSSVRLLADRHPPVVGGLDDALAEDVVDVELVSVTFLGRRALGRHREGLDRLVPDLLSRD